MQVLTYQKVLQLINIKGDQHLADVSATEGSGSTQSASSNQAAGSNLHPPVFPFGGRRHRGDKVVDDWEAVGRDATGGFHSGQTSAGLHLGESISQQQDQR